MNVIFRCLTARANKPIVEKCNHSDKNQQWVFSETKPHWA